MAGCHPGRHVPVELVRTDLLRFDETKLVDFVERVNAIRVLLRKRRPVQERLPPFFCPILGDLAQRRRVGAKVTSSAPRCRLLDCALLV